MQTIGYWLLRARRALQRRVNQARASHLLDDRSAPIVDWLPDKNGPVLAEDFRGNCRTRHGPATLHWRVYILTDTKANRTSQATDARYARRALLPNGSRGDVYSRMGPNSWRREGSGDKVWFVGTVDIRSDDIVFTDAESQDSHYEAPGADDTQHRLERDLALHRPFVEALRDDKFAVVAHGMLNALDWIRIGSDPIEIGSCNCNGFIASLRNKGEDYLDWKLGVLSDGVRISDDERTRLIRQMSTYMQTLGWRTYTEEELEDRAHQDFQTRVERRLEGWRQMAEYEARPQGSHDVIPETLRVSGMLLYVQDDGAWLDALEGESEAATSEQFVLRLKGLASSGRISRAEYDRLFQRL